MTRSKKTLVGVKSVSDEEKELKEKKEQETLLIDLVNVVRKSRTKEKSDAAFAEIEKILRSQIDKVIYRFNIPGQTSDDMRQEASFALRYKAIKDYDQTRSLIKEVSPFDKFAVLCIRRHLTTKRKASFQNKSWALNSAKSLDADRGKQFKSEDNLFLSDIIPQPGGDTVDAYKDKEYFMMLMKQLHSRLSGFEQHVLKLYAHHHSYRDIMQIINKKYKKNIKVKSIDNALMRIKIKGEEVIDKYGDELDKQMLDKRREEREKLLKDRIKAKKKTKKIKPKKI